MVRLPYLPRYATRLITAALTGLLLGAVGTAAVAADRLVLRWGSLSQTIRLEDLERGTDGQMPRLRPWVWPQVQPTLAKSFILDRRVSEWGLKDLAQIGTGQRIREALQIVFPNLVMEDGLEVVRRAAELGTPLTALSLLQQLPQQTVEINGLALLRIAMHVYLAKWERGVVGWVMGRQPAVTATQVSPLAELADPFAAGASRVDRWQLVLQDPNRDRTIPLDIYWSQDSHGPLVVISHGFGANRRFLAYLAQHLASHGLTVVTVEHPGSNGNALLNRPDPRSGSILLAQEFLDRPRDISFVLDQLAILNRYSYSLRHRLNTQQVTLVGHSLGGYTGLALAGAPLDLGWLEYRCRHGDPLALTPTDWLQCSALDLPTRYANLQDQRITQLILLNPLTGLLFGPSGLSQVRVPTLLLASSQDTITPLPTQQLAAFAQLSGEKYLLSAIGASHLSVGDPHSLNPHLRQFPLMPALPDATTANLRCYLRGVSLSFILQQTEATSAYAKFLSSGYADRFSTDQIQLRWSRDLPQELLAWSYRKQRQSYQPGPLIDDSIALVQLMAISLEGQAQALPQVLRQQWSGSWVAIISKINSRPLRSHP
jgi:predicted dienelactone hydrolase